MQTQIYWAPAVKGLNPSLVLILIHYIVVHYPLDKTPYPQPSRWILLRLCIGDLRGETCLMCCPHGLREQQVRF